eukprot:NODE_21291_length_760_cov_5.064771.p2 GENE.NODE_21291_length_760_cov_5.064771~~NODE_21291_length_760_cov_5.064771.p2  ORF type:complete len:140 (+),score=17.98 NODE_21291_length_760_cov_5.064771:165-584(+)
MKVARGRGSQRASQEARRCCRRSRGVDDWRMNDNMSWNMKPFWLVMFVTMFLASMLGLAVIMVAPICIAAQWVFNALVWLFKNLEGYYFPESEDEDANEGSVERARCMSNGIATRRDDASACGSCSPRRRNRARTTPAM